MNDNLVKDDNDYIDEIKKIAQSSIQSDAFKNLMTDYHAYEISEAFVELTIKERKKFYDTFESDELADIFEYLDTEIAANYLKELSNDEAADILDEVDSDDLVDILEEVDDASKSKILKLLSDEKVEDYKELSVYDDNSAGSIMTTAYITLDEEMGVKEAMKKVVANAPEVEALNYIFVIDKYENLKGVISLRRLIIARADQIIKDVMKTNYQTVYYDMDIEDAANVVKDYDLVVLPVIDKTNKLVGIITVDDALDVLEDEADEDYAKFAALGNHDFTIEKETVWSSVKSRLPWLIVLLGIGMLVSGMISGFEHTLEKAPITALFMPLILGMAGNAGTQSLAVTVRYISDGELNKNSIIIKHLFREVRTGIINGIFIGVIAFAIIFVFLNVIQSDQPSAVSFAVAVSAFISLIIASLAGSLTPIIMDKIGIDPAVASGPFITTVNDLVAVLVYFTMATALIPGL